MTPRRAKRAKTKPMPSAGDHVMLGSPLVDPVHWFPGEVLWTDGAEILVQQYGIAMATPHKALHDIDYVRAFGTREHCASEKRRAETIVRDAARQCEEVEEMARDLRRKLIDVFEVLAGSAIKASEERR